MAILTQNAYAKINLFLDIESRRDDGYHNIISVMQSVSLCDTLTVDYENSSEKVIEITCNKPDIPTDTKNIAYKAANIFLTSGHVKIHIKKRIPASGGLAGGSTDAAAVLLMLNKLTGRDIPISELLAIGAKIGADVPFCMVGGTMLTLGIGDQMSKFTTLKDKIIVIARLGDGVSTPKAYSALDAKFDDFKNYTPHTKNLEALKKDTSNYAAMFNIFESVILPQHPEACKVKECMLLCGAELAMMSGSGPSVFGVFPSFDIAEKAYSKLIEMEADAHICHTISAIK